MIRSLAALLVLAPTLAFAQAWDGDSPMQPNRLWAADAPESNQQCLDGFGRCYPCGQKATAALSALMIRGYSCQSTGKYLFGQLLMTCQAGGLDMGEEMLRQGWAVIDEAQISQPAGPPGLAARYRAAQEEAKAGQKGLWAGRFDLPSDWSRHRRQVPCR